MTVYSADAHLTSPLLETMRLRRLSCGMAGLVELLGNVLFFILDPLCTYIVRLKPFFFIGNNCCAQGNYRFIILILIMTICSLRSVSIIIINRPLAAELASISCVQNRILRIVVNSPPSRVCKTCLTKTYLSSGGMRKFPTNNGQASI